MSTGPDIASLLASLGGQGGPPGGGMPGGMMQGQPPSPDDQSGQEDTVALIDQALQAIHSAFGNEADPEIKVKLAKVMALLQDIEAQEQRDRDSVMGNASNMRILRRSA